MTLAELLASAAALHPVLSSSSNPEALNVGTRLQVSARHVSAAQFGARFFGDPTQVAPLTDSATAQTAAMMLVFGCGQASIDLCASSLLRWQGILPKQGRDHDFGDLTRQVSTGAVTLAPKQRRWYDTILSQPDGQQLTTFRDAIVHRVIRQDARVGGFPRTSIAPSTSTSGIEEASILLQRIAAFAEARWREFWSAFA